MKLRLAEGWKQVEPKETFFELLISDQHPGQRLLAMDTSFSRQRDIGYSGGNNCPLAVDDAEGLVFVSSGGIASYRYRGNGKSEETISEDLRAVWMLKLSPDSSSLLMHTHDDSMESSIAWLDLKDRSVRLEPLPTEAFFPLDANQSVDKVVYSARGGGVAVYDVSETIRSVAKASLPFQATGAAFDTDDHRVILGGNGLFGWNTETGELSRLSETGSYPAIHPDGSVWFSSSDGALARLSGGHADSEVVIELAGVDPSAGGDGSYAQPATFSPDGRYGMATLSGRTELTGKELDEAEAFCRRFDQPFTDFYRHAYHHYFCVLDLRAQEVWCHEGYAHNTAWVSAGPIE